MNLRQIWNDKLPSLLAVTSHRPRRRRALGALESLEARWNLSAILVVETINAYWVIEDSTYGTAEDRANAATDNENTDAEKSDLGDGDFNNLDVLPYATTDLLVSPNDGLAHAEKSSQLEDADDSDATPNDSSRSLAQAGDSSLIIGNASGNHADTPSANSTNDATETQTLLNRLLADAGITTADVVSVRLLPNVSLEDLVQSENDSEEDNTTDSSGSDNVSADSSSSHAPRNTTSNASSTPASAIATSPSDQPTSKPREPAAASSASHLVSWLRTYFQEAKPKSAADSDEPELRNTDSTDSIESVRGAILNAAFPQVAAVHTVVANVDQLFAKFQMELADDTGSVSALRYVRTVFDANDPEIGSDTAAISGVSISLSYAQWASLASVVALASGALAKKVPRESRDENRLPPFRARSETKLRVACIAE